MLIHTYYMFAYSHPMFSNVLRSDSDQKSMIDYFRLIGWKTIYFFSIIDFRSFNFGMIEWLFFFHPDFFWFFTNEYAKWQYATLKKLKEKFHSRFSIYFLLLLLTVSLDWFLATNWSIFKTDWSINRLIDQSIFRSFSTDQSNFSIFLNDRSLIKIDQKIINDRDH